MDFASSFVHSDNLPEEIGFGTLGTNRIGKTCNVLTALDSVSRPKDSREVPGFQQE